MNIAEMGSRIRLCFIENARPVKIINDRGPNGEPKSRGDRPQKIDFFPLAV